MPAFTTFLNLSLPALSEFVDSWNEPLNQNFEAIDDWTSDLHANLVGAGTGTTWAQLRGSLTNLATRLDVSIAANGTLDLSSSQDLLDLSISAYKGTFGGVPVDRMNDTDREIYDARQPFADGRFAPMPSAGPSAGFPGEELDSGIAFRSTDFGAKSAQPIASPSVPWSPGLVSGGGGTPLTDVGVGTGRVVFNGTAQTAAFNIDGYLFRIREDIQLDYSTMTPLSVGDYVWFYVERNDANYGLSADLKYSELGGTPIAKDLRKLKTGTGTTASPSTFEDTSGTFETVPFIIKEGDTLRILTGGDAGDYVISVLDGTAPNTKFTIKGSFKVGGVTAAYEIIDNAMPNIGAVIAQSPASDPQSQPPFVEGRVYIGRLKHNTAASILAFTKGGVADSGWGTQTFPYIFQHNLGVVPSKIEIWVRKNTTPNPAHRAVVIRPIVSVAAGADSSLLLPSLWEYADETEVRVDLLNALAAPVVAQALFTDMTGGLPGSPGANDILAADAEIRIVAWR